MRSMPTDLVTAEQLLHLPRGQELRELVRGRLRTMSPAGWRHGMVAARLHRLLAAHVARHALGETFVAEAGFLVARDPDTVLAPDVSFVAAARLASVAAAGFFPGAPDLAVEVRSPDDSRRQLADKARLWLEHGCRMVVVIDPAARTAAIHRPGAAAIEIDAAGAIAGGDVVPGLELRLADLFSL
jgi:Uma2 family endonuclease